MNIDRRSSLKLLAGTGAVLAASSVVSVGCSRSSRKSSLTPPEAMKRAADFMRANCAHSGGYVWEYAADFSRRWGEMEAYPTMIWIQPPGTATMGHLFLDCYYATGDEYYYEAAAEVAAALIAAQHPSGGWNYLHDFAGAESTRRWYDTIGKNGWRLEEFHHYYGNATFDDAGTSEAAQFFLRLYLARREQRFEEPLQRALGFMLDSQYQNGGWPQRFPFVEDMPELHGRPDYTRHITFNDDVAARNIRFLLVAWQTLGDERAADAVRRAMDVFLDTLQPAPQAGWGYQHDALTLRPVGARSYEPSALSPQTTAQNIGMLLDFYEWTAEPRFLARIPEAIDWLESVRLEAGDVRIPGREFPTYIEIGTNRPLYTHRRGSNVANGEYYSDYDPTNPIAHYVQWRAIDVPGLRTRLESLQAMSAQELRAKSPLVRNESFVLPESFIGQQMGDSAGPTASAVLESLNDEGYWPTPLRRISNPYIGPGPETPTPGDFSQTLVGDAYDTSPYIPSVAPIGISTGAFVWNMTVLARAARAASA
jgi:PelA/Pel-15E family pectate lyase